MGTKPPGFPNIRLWIIATSLNQRVARTPRLAVPETHIWSAATRRMLRYFHFIVQETSNPKLYSKRLPADASSLVIALWRPYLSMLVRSLRRHSGSHDARWQRRFFQILESRFEHRVPLAGNGPSSWQECFRLILNDALRSRKSGWFRLFTNISQRQS